MDILFKIGVAWIFLTYYFIYFQTGAYGHLMISLGAGLNLFAYLFMNNFSLVEIMSFLGSILFWGGLAVTATFGVKLERERLKTSSLKEILLGKVPKHLQKETMSERSRVIHGIISSLLFSVIFFSLGRSKNSFYFRNHHNRLCSVFIMEQTILGDILS